MESVLRYIGKHGINLDYEKEKFKFQTYCEPFSGSFNTGHILMEDEEFRGKLILNDLDYEIYNFWNCVKNNPKLTYKRIEELILNVLKANNEDRKRYEITKFAQSAELESRAAAEYIYRLNTGLHGFNVNSRGFKYSEHDFIIQSRNLQRCELHNLDYSEILHKYDSKETFFYLDPPYDIDRVDNYYRCNSSFFYHEGLKNELDKLEGKWLVTYNNSYYLHKLYEGYHKYIIGRPMFNGIYTELVITNYDKPRHTIANYICDADDYDLSKLYKPEDNTFEKFIDKLEGKGLLNVAEVNKSFDDTGFGGIM